MEVGRSYREDDYLKKGEAQLYQLQQQVDEVRRLVREQMARQHGIEENWKQNESRFIQLREFVDRQGVAVEQAIHVRQLEEHRIKQELSELQSRSGEPTKAIRDLRSQLTDILNSRRKDTEQTGLDKLALDKLATSIRDTNSQIGRLDSSIKDLREAVKITANAQEFYQRELERVLDIIHANEQVVRRQADEFRVEIKQLREEVQLFSNRISRVEDLQRQDAAKLEELPAAFDVLRVEDERIMSNILRVEKLMTERYSIYQDRLEELRQQSETQFFNVSQLMTGQNDSQLTRADQLEERIRTLDSGVLELQLRIEQVKQVYESEIYEVYQLEEQMMAQRMEAVQAEFDAFRQNRAKSQAGGIGGRRAVRARAKARTEEENNSNEPPGNDSSI